MQILFDFFPIILFFVAYKLFGIYVATIVAMIASTLQTVIYRLKYNRFEFIHILTLVMIALLGGATLYLHNVIFIKWKPTVLYWILALAFLATQFIGKKRLVQHIMSKKLSLPQAVWNKLNIFWIIFFIIMGFVNLYIVYHHSTNTWVNFKLFGILGFTIIFIIVQSLYMAKYVKHR
jgi:intracellular septation protein